MRRRIYQLLTAVMLTTLSYGCRSVASDPFVITEPGSYTIPIDKHYMAVLHVSTNRVQLYYKGEYGDLLSVNLERHWYGADITAARPPDGLHVDNVFVSCDSTNLRTGASVITPSDTNGASEVDYLDSDADGLPELRRSFYGDFEYWEEIQHTVITNHTKQNVRNPNKPQDGTSQ